jgi:hypothetical protein
MTTETVDEYLERNLAVCSSLGIEAAARVALERLHQMKRPPKWLIEKFEAIHEREAKVRPHLVEHRREVSPYK